MIRTIASRDDLLAALPGDWLLPQLMSHWAEDRPAYACGGAVALYHRFWDEPDAVVLGDAGDAAVLARTVLEHGAAGERVSVPRATAVRLVAEDGLAEVVAWAFRWTGTAPSLPVGGEPAWVPPDQAGEVAEFLATAFPDASMPVGHRDIRRWATLRRDGRLVAVAGDATAVGGLGFLASIASHPDLRGTGAGAAVTAWATAELVREHGGCGLWHMGDNTVAAALYTRLGFSDDHQMAVVGIA